MHKEDLYWRAVVRADDTISFSVSEESASTASRAAFAAITLIYVQVARAHSPKPNLAPKKRFRSLSERVFSQSSETDVARNLKKYDP